MNLSRKNSVAWGNPLSPGDIVAIGASTPVTSTLGELVTAGCLSSCEMSFVTAMVNSQSVLCLVNIGSGCTMVSNRVVVTGAFRLQGPPCRHS